MSFSGRIDRRVYIYAHILLLPSLYVAFGICFAAIASLDATFPTTHLPAAFKGWTLPSAEAATLAWGGGIAAVALLVVTLSFTVRRLHDLDFSGWFLLLWPPLAYVLSGFSDSNDTGLIFEVVLVMVPGTAGPNDHGEDPRPRAVEARAAAASDPARQPA